MTDTRSDLETYRDCNTTSRQRVRAVFTAAAEGDVERTQRLLARCDATCLDMIRTAIHALRAATEGYPTAHDKSGLLGQSARRLESTLGVAC